MENHKGKLLKCLLQYFLRLIRRRKYLGRKFSRAKSKKKIQTHHQFHFQVLNGAWAGHFHAH